jgi:hypothetical protein
VASTGDQLVIRRPLIVYDSLTTYVEHEESFKDVSRLSTMQAMVLLLKAREASPKRGYFWRSWMATVSLVAMAKDLDLDDHYDTHRMGKSCGSTAHDCIAKTRVWQMCLIFEAMIGGPQGESHVPDHYTSSTHALNRTLRLRGRARYSRLRNAETSTRSRCQRVPNCTPICAIYPCLQERIWLSPFIWKTAKEDS